MTTAKPTPRPPRRFARLLALSAALCLAVYVCVAVFMGVFQRRFLYIQSPAYVSPLTHVLPRAERAMLKAPDGTSLSGWWIPPADANKRVYLYFHGNADGLDRRAKRFALMSADGSGVLAMSYRGYGGSGGEPTEILLHADALAIYRDLIKRVAAEQIVAFGESLGTGIAIELARHVNVKAIILDSPYFSVLRRAQANFPWLPVKWLLVDTFRSDRRIGDVQAPILILHGSADRLIPPSDSDELARLAKSGQVRRIVYPGLSHVIAYDRGPDRDVPAFLAGLW